ncbi:MAG: type II CRISPR-associated endonuclease Cas1 [Deltaproteobacteria bacterium]|nr:type II CRISPR-associated endonuclease Cas1 [Deltaproteobacteria bacterium]
MIKRCIDVSGAPYHISISDSQIVLRHGSGEAARIPAEDLGVIVVDHPGVTYSHAALNAMLENNVCLVVCGQNHHPAGLLLPVEGHTVQAEIMAMQSMASGRLKDGLWKEVIKAKITNQAAVLGFAGTETGGLKALAGRVRSGDIGNAEAQAARRYWRLLFGDDFRRDRDGALPNGFLNYGYTVLRAAVARSVCGAGLHPSFGIHHRNRYNAYALADDIMEPYRPMMDMEVVRLWEKGGEFRAAKARLLGVLAAPVEMDGKRLPLMAALQRTAASFRRAITGEEKGLEIPGPIMADDEEDGK